MSCGSSPEGKTAAAGPRPVPPPSPFPAEIAWYGMARMPNATEVGSGSENADDRPSRRKETDGGLRGGGAAGMIWGNAFSPLLPARPRPAPSLNNDFGMLRHLPLARSLARSAPSKSDVCVTGSETSIARISYRNGSPPRRYAFGGRTSERSRCNVTCGVLAKH